MAIELQQILVTMLFAVGFFLMNMWVDNVDLVDQVLRVIAFWMMILSALWAVVLMVRWMIP